MADNTTVGSVEMQKTLGLTGLTMNAMALIAPGAFLWLTFYIQATTGTTGSCHVGRYCARPAALARIIHEHKDTGAQLCYKRLV